MFARLLMFLTILMLTKAAYGQSGDTRSNYVLIKTIKTKGIILGKAETYNKAVINKTDIDRLSTPLRVLATYYSGLEGSDCVSNDSNSDITCELTAALGLGKQGSAAQIALIKKWFPKNKTAQQIIKDKCFVGIPGGSSFSSYHSLSFTTSHDTVIANYKVGYFSHGSSRSEKFNDTAIVNDNKISFIRRGKE